MLADQFHLSGFVVVELKAGNARDQRLEKRLAFEERRACAVAAVEMQKVKETS